MKRASYREAVAWVALNDSAADDDALEVEAVSGLVSTVLVADIFDVDPERVARDIIRVRKQELRRAA